MIHLTFKGRCPSKKNATGVSSTFKDKNGNLRPRQFPLIWYSDVYKDWAKNAIITCISFKNEHKEIEFPLTGQYNLKCLFYYESFMRVDMSALYESVQDILCGASGLKYKGYQPDWYKIIYDDSTRYIASHDGSRMLLDFINPRTEVYLEQFRM